MSWKDRVKNLFTQAVDEIPEPSAQGGGGNPARGPLSYSEDEVRIFVQRAEAKAAEKARAEEREKATAEFAERTKKAEAEASRRERAGRIKARIDAMVSSGKVLPAWVKGGVVEFAASLPTGDSGVIEFGEAGSTTKIAPADWFLNFLEALPRSVHTEETATRANDPGRGTAPGAAATALGGLIRKKMDEKKGMGYAIAFSEVQRENPDLAQAYIEELRG